MEFSWRVYYDEGITWESGQGLENMPSFGVLCILQKVPFRTGEKALSYQIVHGCPYYMLVDTWLHSYENDIVDYLVHGRKINKLLVGRMVSKQVFGDVYEKVQADKRAENL